MYNIYSYYVYDIKRIQSAYLYTFYIEIPELMAVAQTFLGCQCSKPLTDKHRISLGVWRFHLWPHMLNLTLQICIDGILFSSRHTLGTGRLAVDVDYVDPLEGTWKVDGR